MFGGKGALFKEPPVGVFFKASNKADPFATPALVEVVVGVASIHRDDGAFGELELLGDGDVGFFSVAEVSVAGQQAVVVKEEVELGGSFAGAKVRPVEGFDAEFNNGAIKGVELSFEGEGLGGGVGLAAFKQFVKELLVEFGWAMGISVGKGCAAGGLLHAKVL